MSTWMMYSFQDANSPIMENMIWFYDYTMMILMMIIMLVMYKFYLILFNQYINRYLMHGNMIELLWTLLPMLILVLMAIPSLKILYFNDEIYNPLLTIKALGHQWYWSYEYSDFLDLNFDSYLIDDDSMYLEEFRLLDVDNRLILPSLSSIRLLVSSIDVIHSWTVPSLGVKMDATPGRLNQISLFMFRTGLYYGQCSEICGMNHSFMPIVLEVVSLNNWLNWLNFN
uniref:Cytochrome c oxidase subunit 2 n=1 Tax=Ettchellsia sinica TaxID=1738633 RepID=A0A2S0AYG4_9HYME|nr:cytochrome c oxidase subunit II [Ettchellsia sinica]